MKPIYLTAILLFATACAPVPKGEPLPIKQFFSTVPHYECAEYRKGSDSCEAIAVRRVSGNRVAYDAELLMPRMPGVPGRARVNMKMAFRIEGDRYCGNFRNSDVKVSGVPSSYAIDLAIALKTEMAREGDICTRYYRQRNGQYLSVTTRRDGTPIRDGSGPVAFFTAAKKLRPVSMF